MKMILRKGMKYKVIYKIGKRPEETLTGILVCPTASGYLFNCYGKFCLGIKKEDIVKVERI